MDFRRLSMFLAVVEHATFTKAAAELFVSQPGLSQAIRELESELGVELFHRIGRRVVLTAAGFALVEPARQTMRDIDNARAAVAAVAGLDGGRLDIACLPTLAADPTTELVGAFRSRHPAVVVHIADPDDPEEVLDQVRSGTVEVAISEAPRQPPSGVIAHRLRDQELVAILPPGSTATAKQMTLRALSRFGFIVTPEGTSSRRHLDEAFAFARREPTVAVETAQREAIVPLVLAGAGAALVPRTIAETAARSGATVVSCQPKVVRAVALIHRDGSLSPAAQRFAELALQSTA